MNKRLYCKIETVSILTEANSRILETKNAMLSMNEGLTSAIDSRRSCPRLASHTASVARDTVNRLKESNDFFSLRIGNLLGFCIGNSLTKRERTVLQDIKENVEEVSDSLKSKAIDDTLGILELLE